MSDLSETLCIISMYSKIEREKKLGFISNFDSFINILTKINNMIGMVNIKKKINKQIISFIVNYENKGNPIINKRMLHTMLLAPSGYGKTTLAKRLAKLYLICNLVKSNEEEEAELRIKCSKLRSELNNVRKKVKCKNDKDEKVIQAKFQHLKKELDKLSSNGVYRRLPRKSNKICLLTRSDLIAKFQGHTCDKLKGIFKKYEGGVIIIDEAYSLLTSDNDDFGIEIINEITNYMSENPDKIIFIFCGYKDSIENGIMSKQQGMKRRCTILEIEEYQPRDLFNIFSLQVNKEIENIDYCNKLFIDNKNLFNKAGGDTLKFSHIVSDNLNMYTFTKGYNPNLITNEILDISFKEIKEKNTQVLTYYI